MLLFSTYIQSGYNGGKVVVSVIILYLAVRAVTCIQNFIMWWYTSLPFVLSRALDTLYSRSILLRRVFSFRLLGSMDTKDSTRRAAEDLAIKAGLFFESHDVTTKDGYVLTLHRCYTPVSDGTPFITEHARPPVFLMHGLMQDSESFLCGGCSSLAHILATAGYDVWLGNNRGNKYSSRGQPDDCHGFWDFSIDEMAQYDFPAAMEYVTKHTRYSSLAYVGFSQGTTQAFAALSTASPTLCQKISIFVALAPAVFPRGFRDSLISSFFSSGNSEAAVNFVFGTGAMLRLTAVSRRMLSKGFFASAVRHSLSYLFSCSTLNISPGRQQELFQHVYSPSSVKCVLHWLQIIQAGRLSRFGRSTGGEMYDLSCITAPVAVIYGAADELVDAERVVGELNTCVMAKSIPHFEHLELLWADQACSLVFPTIVELLSKH